MFKVRSLRTTGLALALLALPATAWAEDFNITIPIDFTRLPPEVNAFDVSCLVRTRPSDDLTGRVVGDGEVNGLRIAAGTYRGDVTVRFNARAASDPTTARYYSCGLTMHTADRRTLHSAEIQSGRAFPLSRGAPVTTHTEGTIPR